MPLWHNHHLSVSSCRSLYIGFAAGMKWVSYSLCYVHQMCHYKYDYILLHTTFCWFVKVPDDWDVVKTSDARKMSPTHSLLTTSNMIIGSLSKTVSSVTKAMGLYSILNVFCLSCRSDKLIISRCFAREFMWCWKFMNWFFVWKCWWNGSLFNCKAVVWLIFKYWG